MANSDEKEAQIIQESGDDSDHRNLRRRGGWITFPFLIASTAFLTVGVSGWLSNLIVYLIEKFYVKSIDAAQIGNVVSGTVSLLPVAAAVIADSFFGSFSVIFVSSCISFLGLVLLTLSATISSLSPPPCLSNHSNNGASSSCKASTFQFAVLYAGIALSSLGMGGFRFTTATMGADQFDKPEAQGMYFNWFFFTLYAATVVGSTAIVFVEDNVSWGLGFGLSAAANFIGLAIFLSGMRFYRKSKPKGSPFAGLARVVVAAFRKRKLAFSSRSEDYLYDRVGKDTIATPRNNFRFLNRAAQKTEGDLKQDGSIAKPWRQCTVQQVEDLKTIIRIFPLWSSSIVLGTSLGIQASLSILQALTMDRHIGPHFQIPSGSILVSSLMSCSISLSIIDHFLCPAWKKLAGHLPTPLQRIGLGHVLNVLGMAVSAIVESKRLKIYAKNPNINYQLGSGYVVPMSVLWLFPQLILVGIGEAFHFPGQVSLYYQEFPATLRNMSTGLVGLLVGIAFYLSTALIDLIRRVTGWLPDDINKGRLDNVFWVLVVVGVLNFVYYLVCASTWKERQRTQKLLSRRMRGNITMTCLSKPQTPPPLSKIHRSLLKTRIDRFKTISRTIQQLIRHNTISAETQGG